MARIRSVHPEQWSDEDFVELCPWARLLSLGIRNFCDDKGIFEWKPKTLKMKVFPADTVECEELLNSMLSARIVMRFEVDGKGYGAVRNFCKFQRPRKPNDIYPITEEVSDYVGLKTPAVGTYDNPEGGEVPNQCGTSTAPVPNQCGKSDSEGVGVGVGVGVGEEECDSPNVESPAARQVSEAIAIYNDAASRQGWPKVRSTTPARKKSIMARVKDAGGIDGWRDAVDRCQASDFICGRTPSPWAGFGFDWICRPANFLKLTEGNYDNKNGGGTANGTSNDDWIL